MVDRVFHDMTRPMIEEQIFQLVTSQKDYKRNLTFLVQFSLYDWVVNFTEVSNNSLMFQPLTGLVLSISLKDNLY